MDFLITLIYVPWYVFQGLIIIGGWYVLGMFAGKVIGDLFDHLWLK